ncbi:DNA polymerase III subunit gamma/tau [Geobacter argillaceus]|uniref:DNA polymerase III subunit gamma/tau n=1 Tax=Geobacter argillaceus TaxID=345631 RepID=A0A562VFK7_9BACT|nr:DNA polymerase III subunit gamma/tau [Geobacter argillaceus]TWJ16584.1 DNA polymerase III tau subunit [Geobacter argillaceus]
MSYLVLARKWRPQTFDDLVGQEHITRTLANAIETGRIAHAFLFTGARGVGKTSSARIFAKALNCEMGPTPRPCNVCPSCTEITAGNSVDVFEIDGASNTGVDDIRELRENVKYLPSRSRYKIFIIDEVHMLSTSAFNALLKTLEEPPAHIKFIFATTEPHKLPITILSRCQRFDFKRIPLATIVDRLRHIVDREGIAVSDEALTVVARKGDGSMRDSLSTLDQVLAFCGSEVRDEDVVTLLGVVDQRLLADLARAVLTGDTRGALEVVRQVDEFGYNFRQFCQELIGLFRSLLILKVVEGGIDLLDLAESELATQREICALSDANRLQRCLAILMKAETECAHSAMPRLVLEMALVKMATLGAVVPAREILARLDRLEARLGSGTTASSRPSPPAATPSRQSPPPVHQRQQPAAPQQRREQEPAPRPAEPATVAPPEPERPRETPVGGDWAGFVAFVKRTRPLLATKLEKGSPLQLDEGGLQIGFPRGSLELSMLKEKDYHTQLQELAVSFFKRPTVVKIVPISTEDRHLPISLAEKKSLDQAARVTTLKETALRHPMVAAALEIFGGTLDECREPE